MWYGIDILIAAGCAEDNEPPAPDDSNSSMPEARATIQPEDGTSSKLENSTLSVLRITEQSDLRKCISQKVTSFPGGATKDRVITFLLVKMDYFWMKNFHPMCLSRTFLMKLEHTALLSKVFLK